MPGDYPEAPSEASGLITRTPLLLHPHVLPINVKIKVKTSQNQNQVKIKTKIKVKVESKVQVNGQVTGRQNGHALLAEVQSPLGC